MDYQQQLKKLQEGGNYWNPKPGQYKVKALSELEDTEPYIKKSQGKPDEINPQFKLRILVSGEEKLWTFGVGRTLASTHGQIVKLATDNNNTLLNKEFTVAVKNDGTKNDYTIVA